MKEEALKIIAMLESNHEYDHEIMAANMIRRLVEELDYLKDQISFYEIKNLDSGIIGKIGDCNIHDLVHRTAPQTKPLSDDEIIDIWFAIPNGTLKARTIDFARAIEERILNK